MTPRSIPELLFPALLEQTALPARKLAVLPPSHVRDRLHDRTGLRNRTTAGTRRMDVHSTSSVRWEERGSYWGDLIASTYFPMRIKAPSPRTFAGELSAYRVGNFGLSRLSTGALKYERMRGHISIHDTEEFLITMPTEASVDFDQMGRRVRCEPGAFLIQRSNEPYVFEHDRPNGFLVFKVDCCDLEDRIRDPDRFCGRVFDITMGVGKILAELMGQVVNQAHEMDPTELSVVGRQLLELLVLKLDADDRAVTSASTTVRSAHLRRARNFIQNNLRDPNLSPELIASACGISKRYIHEIFSEVNQTVSQYIREQRLLAIRELLRMPMDRSSLAEISYNFGFCDQAQFSRTFKAMFGDAPSAFRLRHAIIAS